MRTSMTGRTSDIDFSFIKSLRRANQLQCHLDGCSVRFADSDERIKAHFTTVHKDLLESDKTNLTALISEVRHSEQHNVSQKASPSPHQCAEAVARDAYNLDRHHDEPLTSHPIRSRAAKAPSQDPAFSRRRQQCTHRGLYDPNASKEETTAVKRRPAMCTREPDPYHKTTSWEDEPTAPLIKQPETRPISQEQLRAEVKGIYAGLVMVESKCIEVDNAQCSQSGATLNNEQWQALIALHRTLLHEHHDFFLASQHPSPNPALRRLASKYAMPARMWRHGIHSFQELLRHRLPMSLEHMLTFIYLAYSMMPLLHETVPAFEDTWIECLRDLSRYAIAIEDDDIHDRKVSTSISCQRYSRASDISPTTGRLYDHLAILAQPNTLQQVFYYTKSLCVPTPFKSARDPIMTLFDPSLGTTNHHQQSPSTGSSPDLLMDGFFSEQQALNFWSIRLEQATETIESKVDLTHMKKHYQQLSNLEKRVSHGVAYFGAKFTNHTTGLKKLVLHVLSYARPNAMTFLMGMILMAPGVAASPTDYRDSTVQSQDTDTSLHEPQWPWHLVVGTSASAWLVLPWIFNRRREVDFKNYETWFLIAALLFSFWYGYKAFVEESLESSWR